MSAKSNNKSLLEVLREQSPLNAKHWSRKIELTLGESILIFYDIEPILSLSNNIQTHIFSAIFNDTPIEVKKLKKKNLIEQTFSSANETTKEILKTYLEEELTVEDLIQEIDKENICDKLIQRWCPSSPRNEEVLRLLTREEFCNKRLFHAHNMYKFSEPAFSRIIGNKGELFFPCLLRPLFGELLKQSEIKVPPFFEVTEELENAIPDRYKNNGDFWTEYRRVETASKDKNIKNPTSKIKPFLSGNQRLMSDLESDDLTKIIVKAFGGHVWKKTKKQEKKNIDEISKSDDLQKILNILENYYVGKKNRKEKSDSSIQKWLSEVNPFPQKERE